MLIRPFDPRSDRALVVDTWVESYRLSAVGQSLPPDVYTRRWHSLVDRVLSAPETEVRIAADDEEPTVIMGWLCWDKTRRSLHYVFCRDAFRLGEIARRLITGLPTDSEHRPTTYTSRTVDWQKCGVLLAPRLRYDPTYLWRYFGNVVA